MVRTRSGIALLCAAGLIHCTSEGGGSVEPNPIPCRLVAEPPLKKLSDGSFYLEVGDKVQFTLVGLHDGKNYNSQVSKWSVRMRGSDPYDPGTITSTGLYTAPSVPTPGTDSPDVWAEGGDPKGTYWVGGTNFRVLPKPTAEPPLEGKN